MVNIFFVDLGNQLSSFHFFYIICSYFIMIDFSFFISIKVITSSWIIVSYISPFTFYFLSRLILYFLSILLNSCSYIYNSCMHFKFIGFLLFYVIVNSRGYFDETF